MARLTCFGMIALAGMVFAACMVLNLPTAPSLPGLGQQLRPGHVDRSEVTMSSAHGRALGEDANTTSSSPSPTTTTSTNASSTSNIMRWWVRATGVWNPPAPGDGSSVGSTDEEGSYWQAISLQRSQVLAYVQSDEFAQFRAYVKADAACAERVQASATASTNSSAGKNGASGCRPHTGRGIVIPTGGKLYLPQAVILLRTLRKHLNCTMPVELVWRGPSEMDNTTLKYLQDIFPPLYGYDALDITPRPYDPPGVQPTGFQIKPFAILHSRFTEVMLLDSDVVLAACPDYLFDSPTYVRNGNLFWGDIYFEGMFKNEIYSYLGLNSSVAQVLDASEAPFKRYAESGQVMIDRARHLDVLEWCWWLNALGKQNTYEFVYGDKDLYALAFALAGRPEAYTQLDIPPAGIFTQATNLGWKPDAAQIAKQGGWWLQGLVHFDPYGQVLLQHRVTGEIHLHSRPPMDEVLSPPLPRWWTMHFMGYRQVPSDEAATPDSISTSIAALEVLQLNLTQLYRVSGYPLPSKAGSPPKTSDPTPTGGTTPPGSSNSSPIEPSGDPTIPATVAGAAATCPSLLWSAYWLELSHGIPLQRDPRLETNCMSVLAEILLQRALLQRELDTPIGPRNSVAALTTYTPPTYGGSSALRTSAGARKLSQVGDKRGLLDVAAFAALLATTRAFAQNKWQEQAHADLLHLQLQLLQLQSQAEAERSSNAIGGQHSGLYSVSMARGASTSRNVDTVSPVDQRLAAVEEGSTKSQADAHHAEDDVATAVVGGDMGGAARDEVEMLGASVGSAGDSKAVGGEPFTAKSLVNRLNSLHNMMSRRKMSIRRLLAILPDATSNSHGSNSGAVGSSKVVDNTATDANHGNSGGLQGIDVYQLLDQVLRDPTRYGIDADWEGEVPKGGWVAPVTRHMWAVPLNMTTSGRAMQEYIAESLAWLNKDAWTRMPVLA